MSGLTYSGIGLIVLTAAGLAVKGLHKIWATELEQCPLRPVSGARRLTTLGPGPVTVAVVVPAHNEAATIEQTIRSCLHQTYPVAQVIVVADNCTDATAALARAAGAMVIEGSGGSKASAQNLALPHVVADLVVALDGDNILDATAVTHMVATMQAGYAGTCTSVLPKDTTTIFSQYRTLYHALANGWTKKIQDTLGRQLVLNGMANCHRTDVLTTMGGFPDDSVTEDFNLTWALHRQGYAVAFTAQAFVYTQEPTSFRELISQMHRWTAGFAQCMVTHHAPLVDAASFLVVVSLAGDALLGGLATVTFLPFAAHHGIRACWRWWGRLWILISVASVGVAISQLGVRTTLRCLPGWFILQNVTGPIATWWLVREWVLGRHLTAWTGRHGRKPTLTPMSPRRKAVLAATTALAGVVNLAIRRIRARKRSARVIDAEHAVVANLRRGHHYEA
jgi:cellulose synthase/poly-beta-1,6-N-acetylglucosamine synthase-like glycosyltransferase